MCSLCQEPADKSNLVHLQLYVNGSEGCWVCFRCRTILTQMASGIQLTAASVKFRTLKDLKKDK